jgi:Mrp family chromosome partitioning ATPase
MATTHQGQSVQAAQESTAKQEQEARLRARMDAVGQKLLVLSGKGGVGKSTVAANVAVSLSRLDKEVGLLDVDVHGPSLPTIMGLAGATVTAERDGLVPVRVNSTLAAMSIGLLLQQASDAVIWRGPRKFHLIRQFLADVVWGALDYLVVDCPPGTGDEPLAVAELVGRPAGAIVVTTPQALAISDVRRCITFCRTVSLPVVGIIENMSGFICPHCEKTTDVFNSGGGLRLADEMQVPFLGRIPLDPRIACSGDEGTPFMSGAADDVTAKAFMDTVKAITGDQGA